MAGKARYAGLVAPAGWQLATVAERGRALGGITVPVSAQVEYSLLCRDPEAELLPAAVHHGVGLLAWAPLGRGVLTGKYADGTPADSRGASPALAPYVEARRNERSARIVQAVLTAADGLGTSPLSVALAWVRDRPGVAAAIVGARDAAQLAASTAADGVVLPRRSGPRSTTSAQAEPCRRPSRAPGTARGARLWCGDSTWSSPAALGGTRKRAGGEPVERGGPTGTSEGDLIDGNLVDGDWEYRPVQLPGDVSRMTAAVRLAIQAEFGGWELSRVRLYPGGVRKVVLRRRRSSRMLPELST